MVLGASPVAGLWLNSAAAIAGGSAGSVAIIRISGQAAVAVARSIFRRGGGSSSTSAATSNQTETNQTKATEEWQPQTQRIYYGEVIDAQGDALDEVLMLTMLAPRSYTREDVVEVCCPNSAPFCSV